MAEKVPTFQTGVTFVTAFFLVFKWLWHFTFICWNKKHVGELVERVPAGQWELQGTDASDLWPQPRSTSGTSVLTEPCAWMWCSCSFSRDKHELTCQRLIYYWFLCWPGWAKSFISDTLYRRSSLIVWDLLFFFLCLCWFSLATNRRRFRSPVHRWGDWPPDWGVEAAWGHFPPSQSRCSVTRFVKA